MNRWLIGLMSFGLVACGSVRAVEECGNFGDGTEIKKAMTCRFTEPKTCAITACMENYAQMFP